MAIARDHLDVLVLPADPDGDIDVDAVRALFDQWQGQGLLASGTGSLRRTAGPRAWALVQGGFSTVWLDRPDRPTLYANQLGGFRVPCPHCRAPMAQAFSQATQRWRGGETAVVVECGACGVRTPLYDVPLYPPGGFAHGAVVFADAGSLEPSGTALRELRTALAGVRVVLRRRGS
ncbi:MAG: hypothetical protein H6742_21290 [Alphaproteobacteria bacterium]|nr:hypothetical protein [Alphaproteobacteria bacterium]